jgi:hypothetical protein
MIQHYDVAKKVEDLMRLLWEVRPLVRGMNGKTRADRSLRQKLGPLELCVQTVANRDGVDIIMLRRGCYTTLTQHVPSHVDGIAVRIVDPDPTEEKEMRQLHIGEDRMTTIDREDSRG